MPPTSQELLDLLNTAIETRIAGGMVQSYTINGRNLARDPLDKLIELRKTLQGEVASASGGGRNYARFDRTT